MGYIDLRFSQLEAAYQVEISGPSLDASWTIDKIIYNGSFLFAENNTPLVVRLD